MSKPPLTVLLASPRGFCAGVVRAIATVEAALERYGPPVYVRHQIVHNSHVVEQLRAKGARFVEDLAEVPDEAVVISSAHGVPRAVHDEALQRRLRHIDGTCPLVSKVHREVTRHVENGRTVILVGRRGHAEVIGTMGQVPPGTVRLVENVADAEAVPLEGSGRRYAYATQTTLSIEDAAAVVSALRRRLPDLPGPRRNDICYASANRQAAVKLLARRCELVIVLGSETSANARELVDTARRAGCGRALLVDRAADLDMMLLAGAGTIGATSGASTPESLVDELIERLSRYYAIDLEPVVAAEESLEFGLPRI